MCEMGSRVSKRSGLKQSHRVKDEVVLLQPQREEQVLVLV